VFRTAHLYSMGLGEPCRPAEDAGPRSRLVSLIVQTVQAEALATLIVHTVKAGSLNAGTERRASDNRCAGKQVERCLVILSTVAAVCASLQPTLARLARHLTSAHMHILH